MQQIHHKRNELFEVEFYEDKECTEAFDFMDKKDLYIELVNGDITPLVRLRNQAATWQNIYTPYLCEQFKYYEPLDKIKTLDDITPNLSKYIPEDNAVLFLSADSCEKYMQCFQNHHIGLYANDGLDKVTLEGSINAINEFVKNPIKKLTIFLEHGTQAELQKANEVAKELGEKYKVEEVSVIALHWFGSKYEVNAFEIEYLCEDFGTLSNINKIITTNSTGILKPEDSKGRLQVIDCKEIFEEYLKENN